MKSRCQGKRTYFSKSQAGDGADDAITVAGAGISYLVVYEPNGLEFVVQVGLLDDCHVTIQPVPVHAG